MAKIFGQVKARLTQKGKRVYRPLLSGYRPDVLVRGDGKRRVLLEIDEEVLDELEHDLSLRQLSLSAGSVDHFVVEMLLKALKMGKQSVTISKRSQEAAEEFRKGRRPT